MNFLLYSVLFSRRILYSTQFFCFGAFKFSSKIGQFLLSFVVFWKMSRNRHLWYLWIFYIIYNNSGPLKFTPKIGHFLHNGPRMTSLASYETFSISGILDLFSCLLIFCMERSKMVVESINTTYFMICLVWTLLSVLLFKPWCMLRFWDPTL